jgi:hypothetical protein
MSTIDSEDYFLSYWSVAYERDFSDLISDEGFKRGDGDIIEPWS